VTDEAGKSQLPKGEVQIRLLAAQDVRAQFCSGDIELDRFFQRFAGQNQFRHHIGSTYVSVLNGRITGFATVSAGELTADTVSEHLKKKLPSYPVPILRIARLAVDKHFQGHGIGKMLLRSMFELALELRDKVGCAGRCGEGWCLAETASARGRARNAGRPACAATHVLADKNY
jgi:GNAT superfamily N-acetyltransferase